MQTTTTLEQLFPYKDMSLRAKRIAQEEKSITRLRAKGHCDFKGFTDEQIVTCAQKVVDLNPSGYIRYYNREKMESMGLVAEGCKKVSYAE